MSKKTIALKLINDKYARDENMPLIMRAGDNIESLKPQVIPSNIPELNAALGGGFAKGTLHLLAGTPGAGKTTTALSVIKSCQDLDPDAIGLYVCLEPPFPYNACVEIGIDFDRLLVIQPTDSGEDMIDTLYTLLFDTKTRKLKGLIDVFVWDSLNNTQPKKAIDRQEAKGSAAPDMASRAGMLTDFLERLNGRGMLRGGVVGLLIAQLRANLSGYGSPWQLSGGYAPQFNSKTINTFSHKLVRDKDGFPVAQTVTVDITKNNITGKPTKCQYTYDYSEGIDDSRGLMTVALEAGWIYKKGRSTYVFEIPGLEPVMQDMKKDDVSAFLKSSGLIDGLREAVFRPIGDEIEGEETEIVEAEIEETDTQIEEKENKEDE